MYFFPSNLTVSRTSYVYQKYIYLFFKHRNNSRIITIITKNMTVFQKLLFCHLDLISCMSLSAFCSCVKPVLTPSNCDCIDVFNMASTED